MHAAPANNATIAATRRERASEATATVGAFILYANEQ
jgi:hypothetical protein